MAVSDEQLGNLRGEYLAERYELGAICGRGAFCVVYSAADVLLHRTVAIKVSSLSVADAYQEALAATGAISYPAFLAVYDVIEQSGRLYVVQEYIDGHPLSHYLANGAPARRGAALALQLARGIAYAHLHDLTHGDLTPSSILIDRLAMAHINNMRLPPDWDYFSSVATAAMLSGMSDSADTTLARLIEDERLRDIWAIGAVLWLLLTIPVGEAQAPYGVTARQFREDVAPELRTLLVRVLDPNHREHIASADSLALALEAHDASMTLAASDPSAQVPPSVSAYRESRASSGQRETPIGYRGRQSGYRGNLYFESVASEVTSPMMVDRNQTRPANGMRKGPTSGRNPALVARRTAPLRAMPDDLAEVYEGTQTTRLWMWVTFGVVLFVAFFLVGYFVVPLFSLF